MFHEPFSLEQDVVIDPESKVEGEALIAELNATIERKDAAKVKAREAVEADAADDGRGDSVVVDGCKILWRSEVDIPTYSQHSPSKEERVAVEKEVNRRPAGVPKRYWDQRYRLFSRFHRGIQLDEESWYSVRECCR